MSWQDLGSKGAFVAGIAVGATTALAAMGIVVVTLGAVYLGPSDGGTPPYPRFAGFFLYAGALMAASYDAWSSTGIKAGGLSPRARILVTIALAGGVGYQLLFFAFAPWNQVALALAVPGLIGLFWLAARTGFGGLLPNKVLQRTGE